MSGAQFGVVVVTAANQHAPWLNFEAGALSKTISGDLEHRVVPLLVDLSGPSQLTGPMSQFQAKVTDREGVLALLRSLGAVAGIDDAVVAARLEAYWPSLREKIEAAKAKDAAVKGKPKEVRREQADVLDEILLHVRRLRAESEPVVVEAPARVSKHAVDMDDVMRSLMEPDGVLAELASRHSLRVLGVGQNKDGRLRVAVRPVSAKKATWQNDVGAFEQRLLALFPDMVTVHVSDFHGD